MGEADGQIKTIWDRPRNRMHFKTTPKIIYTRWELVDEFIHLVENLCLQQQSKANQTTASTLGWNHSARRSQSKDKVMEKMKMYDGRSMTRQANYYRYKTIVLTHEAPLRMSNEWKNLKLRQFMSKTEILYSRQKLLVSSYQVMSSKTYRYFVSAYEKRYNCMQKPNWVDIWQE